MRFIHISFTSFFLFLMIPNISNATEVFSCKTVSEAHLSSEKAYGSALYGDSDFDRSLLSQQPTKVLIIEHKKQVTFGGDVYKHLKGSSSQFYENSYWGLIEVYDKNESNVTLFTTRSNGYGSLATNQLDVKLYHCNK